MVISPDKGDGFPPPATAGTVLPPSSPTTRSPNNNLADSPGGLAATGSDTVLATAGYDHTIKLWQVGTALCFKTFQHPDSQVNDLAISPDRKSVAAAGFQHVRIYDVQGSGQSPAVNFEGLTKNVTCIGFNRDGQWMFSGGEDDNARIWDLRTNATQKVFQTHSSPITCATLHPNNTELIIADQSGTIHLWNLKNDKTEQLIPDQSGTVPIQDVAIDPSGKFLAAVNNKGDCYIWTLDGGNGEEIRLSPFHRLKAHSRYALTCCFSPDSSLVADLHCSGQRWVWSAAFTGDSQYIITASSDNLARLWSLETARTEREYNGHQKPVTCVAYRDPSILY
ncbi:Target of rapamycin complex subunit lst8 [Folsomia candida]|uniref:Target of rapamycin complex subunit lst8 n=1 Tax=Folsomia candida TaxID=158441 RepID=A0A226E0E6_FOLCA|nr:Target of rapamycin complex subunit lst8 [Folsomia candida]